MASTVSPEALVRAYLTASAARDVAAAQGFLAEDAEIVFPGGAPRRTAAEIFAGSARRYQSVDKVIERVDVAPGTQADERVVYCSGTLFGVWTDGTPFEGIRFIDRFVVRDGRIQSQMVWNDTAFVRPPARDAA
ncbi:nuclear transport factor 2 family protein [Roseospira goensis]|uniref:Ketosteroid isomerase-like protein n=1 Tax=Roseospira goensis TaxID=391922 RepID=A0A7W6S263_9PROT|nr:nuclear transport factor 2 family protein [Roseospira goensis]MBB4287377.1 ketosteroid isomerase-like protein [Roseospira goensis]